jgi:hypothetical protein
MLYERTLQPGGGSSCRAGPSGHSGNHPPHPHYTPDTIAASGELYSIVSVSDLGTESGSGPGCYSKKTA